MAKCLVLSEHVEQRIFVYRARLLLERKGIAAPLFAIPNGGLRAAATASRLKAEGVLAGVPDLMLAYPCGRFHGLFLEMKRGHGGRVSAAQQEVMGRLEAAGYMCIVAHGALEAEQALEDYLQAGGGLSLPPAPDVQ